MHWSCLKSLRLSWSAHSLLVPATWLTWRVTAWACAHAATWRGKRVKSHVVVKRLLTPASVAMLSEPVGRVKA